MIRPPKAEARAKLPATATVSFMGMEDLGIDVKIAGSPHTRTLQAVAGSYTYFADGDVLLAKITPCFQNGKLGIARGLKNGVGFGSSEFIVLRPHAGLDAEYLYYFLSREDFRRGGVLRMGGSVGQQRVPQEYVEQQRIPLPPLPEQHRIVAILDEAFAAIATAKANAEKNLQNARALSESVLDNAISGRATEMWRNHNGEAEQGSRVLQRILSQRRGRHGSTADYQQPAPAATVDLPQIPSTWVYATVEQLLRDDSGLAYGILKPGEPDPGGVPMIRVMDIGRGRMNDTEIFKVTKKLSDEFKRTILEENDIMLAVMATVGRCAIVPSHLVGANVNRALAVLKLAKGISVKYVLLALLSPRIQSLFQKNKVGAAQARINLTELRRYAIPLPPLAEQHAIVERVEVVQDRIEHLESLMAQKLAALEAVKVSLLHHAFSGRLTAGSAEQALATAYP